MGQCVLPFLPQAALTSRATTLTPALEAPAGACALRQLISFFFSVFFSIYEARPRQYVPSVIAPIPTSNFSSSSASLAPLPSSSFSEKPPAARTSAPLGHGRRGPAARQVQRLAESHPLSSP